jgi:hypothetical protein
VGAGAHIPVSRSQGRALSVLPLIGSQGLSSLSSYGFLVLSIFLYVGSYFHFSLCFLLSKVTKDYLFQLY